MCEVTDIGGFSPRDQDILLERERELLLSLNLGYIFPSLYHSLDLFSIRSQS